MTGEKLTSKNRMVNQFGALRAQLCGRDTQDLVIGAVVLAVTYAIAGYYTGGDQVGYGKAYLIVRGVDPVAGFNLYRTVISTIEIGHYCINYIASNLLLEKVVFYSYTNAVLAVLIMRLFRRLNASVWIALVFVLSNFYIVVLYFSAERLKLAFIVLLIAVEFNNVKWRKYVLSAIALSTHVTVVLMFGRALYDNVRKIADEYKNHRRLAIYLTITLVIIMLIYWIAGDYIYWKANQYIDSANFSLTSLLPTAACMALSLLYSKEKNSIFVDYVPIIVAVILVGGSRINMFACFLFLWHALPQKNGINVGILGASIYMAYKSIIFIYTVLRTGQGF